MGTRRLIAGTETGLLRVVDVERPRETRLVRTTQQDRKRGVLALAWASTESFVCARKNGDLERWEESTGESAFEDDAWELRSVRRLVGECAGLASTDARVVSCSDDGRLQVWGEDDDARDLDVEGQVSAFDVRGERVAVGGREHELSVWNLATFDREWRARNVPHDFLDARRPVWVSAAQFLSETTLLIGTRHRQLRVYDTRAQRRPVAELEASTEHAVRSLLALDDATALLGDVAGDVRTFDLRKLRVKARYPGPAGSVRALAKHPRAPTLLFAAAGLDRHVHVWDASKRDKRPLASLYCKQRLTALLWREELSPRRATPPKSDDDDDSDESEESEEGT